ncbi:DKNYY domain-containing protein [Thalassomonas actiniarum]|uniref:DKNYY domain-containing protein n=1 Tax=Thalassomonas actiniarum TaxID=485447 RepID=A0AAF0C5V8_9GAMM|nr:DKNYY domain-containing protein [Thalassomonas actiniarum]WDE01546.1 DKNYY domain-containing protein [Thalassomonas actiniarum]
MTSPHWLIIVFTLALLPIWAGFALMSPMLFAAPGSDTRTNILSVVLFSYFPLGVWAWYWHMNWHFLSLDPQTIFYINLGFISYFLWSFGYFKSLYRAFSPINYQGYCVYDGQVYFNGEKMLIADEASFSLLKHAGDRRQRQTLYAKDATHVYFKGQILKGADSKSFCSADLGFEDYFVDSKAVFFDGKAIPDSVPGSFLPFGDYYYKDSRQVYYRGKVLAGVDPGAAVISCNIYLKCGEALFRYGSLIPGVNARLCRILNYHVVADEKNIYFDGKAVLEGADAKNFKLITPNNRFYTDDKHVFYLAEDVELQLAQLTPQSLELLDFDYLRAQGEIYFLSHRQRLPELIKLMADAQSFSVAQALPEFDAEDKNHKFLRGNIVAS